MCVFDCICICICWPCRNKGSPTPTLSPKLVKGSIHPQPRHCSAADIPPVAGAVFTWSLPRFKLQSLGNGQLLLLVWGMTPHPSILTTNIAMKTQMCFFGFLHTWMVQGYMGTWQSKLVPSHFMSLDQRAPYIGGHFCDWGGSFTGLSRSASRITG